MHLILKYTFKLAVYIFIAFIIYLPLKAFKRNKIEYDSKTKFFKSCLFLWSIGVVCILMMPILNFDLLNMNIHVLFPSGFSFEISPTGLNNTTGEFVFGKCNFIPFSTISGYFINSAPDNIYKNEWFWYGIINIFGNVLLFVPLGLLMPLTNKRYTRVVTVMLRSIIFISILELLQILIGRSCDIDDLILNSSGVFLGYEFYKLIKFIQPKALHNA